MFCYACLSSDRTTSILDECYDIYLKICGINNKVSSVPVSLCWECKALLYKIKEFRTKVIEAQKFISSYISNVKAIADQRQGMSEIVPVPIMLDNIKSLSTLTSVTKNTYDVHYFFPLDSLTEESIDIKPEIVCFKEEIRDIICEINCDNNEQELKTEEAIKEEENHDNFGNFKDNIVACPQNTNVRDYEEQLSNISENDSYLSEEMSKMFEEVVFTKERMIKIKETKRNHMNYKSLPYKCDTCVVGFKTKQKFDLHITKKHDEKRGHFSCSVCDMKFCSDRAVARHERKHYVWYKCRLCKYNTKDLWRAKLHCRSMHSNDTLNEIHCEKCHFVAIGSYELDQHMKIAHTYYCNECGLNFRAKSILKRHIRRAHTVEQEYICDLCRRTFTQKTVLETHMMTHNAALATRMAYCTICNVQYKNIKNYRNHLRYGANHAKKIYSCSICNKNFTSQAYLRQHINFYHLRISQFKCELCNKIFLTRCRLKSHKQVHHDLKRPRNHSCDICLKKFYTSSMLKKHKMIHSDERPFMCADCGDTFKQASALYTHCRRTHKVGKRYKKEC